MMQTLGYISNSLALGHFFWKALPDNAAIRADAREVVFRDEVETAIKTATDELSGALSQLEKTVKERDEALHAAKGWEEMAATFSRGQDFYHGLINDMGRAIGPRSFTSDDGSVQSGPLALVVRDIVVDSYSAKAGCSAGSPPPAPSFLTRLRVGLRIIFTGK